MFVGLKGRGGEGRGEIAHAKWHVNDARGIIGLMNLENLRKIKYWGASTSAHQVEGGNHNQWSVWELENASDLAANAEKKFAHWLPRWDDVKKDAQDPKNYVSGKAADHYNLYEKDFDILQKLNMNAFRFSIEWSRVEPEEGRWDETEIEHYRTYLKALKKRNIEPFVTLWHWTVPVWFAEKGSFEKYSNIKYFVRFVEKITDELGDLIKFVIVLNEPNVYVGLSYNDGLWPPQKTNPVLSLWVQRNLISAQKKSYKILKAKIDSVQVGLANQAAYVYQEDERLFNKVAVWSEKTFWNNWVWDRVKLESDFIGLNYYFSDRWRGGTRPDNPNSRTNDFGWDMQPSKIEHVIVEMHERYNKPIFITENGVADCEDQYRQWWLEETLGALDRAIGRGARIGGYLHWSLLDNFEWADGFWPRFGLVEVDYKTMKRTVRPSAKWYADQIKQIRKNA